MILITAFESLRKPRCGQIYISCSEPFFKFSTNFVVERKDYPTDNNIDCEETKGRNPYFFKSGFFSDLGRLIPKKCRGIFCVVREKTSFQNMFL